MLPKVSGYAGFQSYGNVPYPSLKAGKNVLSPNNVWEQTTREQDHQKVTENYHYYNSNYHKTQVENTQPKDFKDHKHVKPGYQHSLRKTAQSTLTKFDPMDQTSNLNTGVEHWVSNYKANCTNSNVQNKAQRPEWTKNKEPYTVQSKLGPSEYITRMGELGSKPTDKWDEYGNQKDGPLSEPLKMGTVQATKHIPNYTGFIPAANTSGKALKQAEANEPRQVFSKISIVENYNTKIPGYAGHQPQNPINQRGQIRESCFTSYQNRN